MRRAAERARYTYDEYRRFEEATDAKHEYIDGEILAMAGGTPEHAALAAAVIAELSRQLVGGPCTTFTSDLRVRVRATGLATYPDATVICGDLERDPEDPNAAVNPTVLIEVLSDSTAAYDAGEKFAHYRQIPHLREYVLVSHQERRIEVRRRDPGDAWQTLQVTRGGTLHLASIGADLSLDTLYDRSPLTRPL
ncbi:MAG: Uma2 family endonuclease [Deltaproteobacteria bacterium]|nr:MAG: Uma2 family endonuclease [Deltaproteobacteria bacterium]TMA66586.1 MAG: Uma2 family endonuclease [Deltaproteobacteria bacterium]